jgi:hypothetical protein
LAQLVERVLYTDEVAGSSPALRIMTTMDKTTTMWSVWGFGEAPGDSPELVPFSAKVPANGPDEAHAEALKLQKSLLDPFVTRVERTAPAWNKPARSL